MREITYDRPVVATLHVHLANGETWEATPTDLERFGLVRRLDAYMSFDVALSNALRAGGVLDGDITDAELNPVRYLAEIAISHPDLLGHPEHDSWSSVAELERKLQQVTFTPMGGPPCYSPPLTLSRPPSRPGLRCGHGC